MEPSVSYHLALLASAVFKPKVAVELALKHPNTKQLAWVYVFAAALFSSVVDVIVVAIAKYSGLEYAPSEDGWQILDSPWFYFTVTLAFYALMYKFALWYWNRFVKRDPRAIAAAFACALALEVATMFPFDLAIEFGSAWRGPMQFLSFVVIPLILLAYSAAYFSLVLAISGKRAVIHTVFSNVLLLAVLLVLLGLGAFVYFFVIDASLSSAISSILEI